MIINAPYTPSNLRGGGNYHSDHTQKNQNPTVLSGAEKEQKRAVALVM